MSVKPKKTIGLLLLLSSVGLMGCGSSKPTADVAGTITFDGKSPDVDGLTITFMSPEGQPWAVVVNRDGTFKGQGIAVGENRLSLALPGGDAEVSARPGRNDKKAAKKIDADAAPKGAGISIPKKLKDPQTSGKTIMVEAGKENTLTWDVKS